MTARTTTRATASAGTGTADTAELVRRAGRHDRAAFAALVRECRPTVTRMARRHVSRPADVDDVVQEVLVVLWRHAGDIRTPERLTGWLRSVTAHTAHRHRARDARLALGLEVEAVADGDLTEDLGLRRSRQGELQRAVAEALGRLAPVDRRLLELLMGADRPDYREVSRAVDRPVGSIGPTRQRLLARLRRDPAIDGLGSGCAGDGLARAS